MAQYEKIVDRSKAVLNADVRKALGESGRSLLYDAVLIMAFADGEIVDEETLFLNDLAQILGTEGSADDLTPDSLLERVSELTVDPIAAEAFVKILLIVSDLDDDVDKAELHLWHQIAMSLGIQKGRLIELRQLLTEAHLTDGDSA